MGESSNPKPNPNPRVLDFQPPLPLSVHSPGPQKRPAPPLSALSWREGLSHLLRDGVFTPIERQPYALTGPIREEHREAIFWGAIYLRAKTGVSIT